MSAQRAEFEMTEQQFDRLLSAMQPVPYMLGAGGVPPRSVQENANDAWKALADELGFVWDTVEPVSGKGQRVFSAIAATGQKGK
jgi:hypothetical protein